MLGNGIDKLIRVYRGKLEFNTRSGGEVQNIKHESQNLSEEREFTCKR